MGQRDEVMFARGMVRGTWLSNGGGGGVEVRFRGDELILWLENIRFGENVIWFCFSKDRPIVALYFVGIEYLLA